VVDCDPEGRVFGSESGECLAHLLLVAFGLGLDSDLDHRVREIHPLEHYRVSRVRQRIPVVVLFEPGQRDNVAGQRLLDVLAVIGVHLQHPADPFATAFDSVQHLAAACHHAGIDTHKRQ